MHNTFIASQIWKRDKAFLTLSINTINKVLYKQPAAIIFWRHMLGTDGGLFTKTNVTPCFVKTVTVCSCRTEVHCWLEPYYTLCQPERTIVCEIKTCAKNHNVKEHKQFIVINWFFGVLFLQLVVSKFKNQGHSRTGHEILKIVKQRIVSIIIRPWTKLVAKVVHEWPAFLANWTICSHIQ